MTDPDRAGGRLEVSFEAMTGRWRVTPAGPGHVGAAGSVAHTAGPLRWVAQGADPEALIVCELEAEDPGARTPSRPSSDAVARAVDLFGDAVRPALDAAAAADDLRARFDPDPDRSLGRSALGWLGFLGAIRAMPGFWAVDELVLRDRAGLVLDDDLAFDALELLEALPSRLLTALFEVDADQGPLGRAKSRLDAARRLVEASGLATPPLLDLLGDVDAETAALFANAELAPTALALLAGPGSGGARRTDDTPFAVLTPDLPPGILAPIDLLDDGRQVEVQARFRSPDATLDLWLRVVDRSTRSVVASTPLAFDARTTTATGAIARPTDVPDPRFALEVVPDADDPVEPLWAAVIDDASQAGLLASIEEHRAAALLPGSSAPPGDVGAHRLATADATEAWAAAVRRWDIAVAVLADAAADPDYPSPGAVPPHVLTRAVNAATEARRRAARLAVGDRGHLGEARPAVPQPSEEGPWAAPFTSMELGQAIASLAADQARQLSQIEDPGDRAMTAHRLAWFTEHVMGPAARRQAGALRLVEGRALTEAGMGPAAVPVLRRARCALRFAEDTELLLAADQLLDALEADQ